MIIIIIFMYIFFQPDVPLTWYNGQNRWCLKDLFIDFSQNLSWCWHDHPPSSSFSGRGWPWTEWWMRLTRRSVRGSWLVHHHSQSLFDLKQSHQTAVSLSPINAKQVTSEWGSYLRSYKLDQDILPGGQISLTADTSPYGSIFKRWVNFASYATG